MLDRSVEFKNIIMRIEKEALKAIEQPVLPHGFSFRYYISAKDMKFWSEIESSVLEFESVSEAEDYFLNAYYPYEKELKNRCLFIIDKKGLPVATATIWYADSELGHQASLHWVAVRPEYQGIGLGKAIVLKALQEFDKLEPDCAVWLHTQTWSHAAIRLYRKLGFNILKQDRLANNNTKNGIAKVYQNDYSEAINLLKKVMESTLISDLIDTAL